MKRFFRLLSLAAVGIGAMVFGAACYEGYERGFYPDLELGNWDPVVRAAIGAAVVALGAIAYLYFGHAAAGGQRSQAFAAALRGVAAMLLVACEMIGVVAAVAGFIIFLAIEKSGGSGVWALGICVCGIVARHASVYLLPWAKGADAKAPKGPNSIASFDDRE